MPKAILGRKLGMMQIFDERGSAVPVTVIEAGPCTVVQKKTVEKDGYAALQLGFGDIRERLVNGPLKGHYTRAGAVPQRHLREIRVGEGEDLAKLEVGAKLTAAIFASGEHVDVTGLTKGKGFAGVVKRHGFRRGPMAHGSMYHRRVGSLGATDPARVFKGRRMPGRLGGARRTIQGLKVVRVDPERNLLLIKGSVPGNPGSLVLIRQTVKHKK